MFGCLGAHPRGQLARLVERLAPQRVDVGVFAGDRNRCLRSPAEIHRHVRLAIARLQRLDFGERVLEAVVRAFMVKGALGRPYLVQHVEIFVGAGVALIVVQPVAVAALFLVGAAGDVVHGEPATAELVERGELPRRQRGRDEAGPVREHEVDALGHRGGMGHRERGVGAGRMVRHQHAVEAGRLVRLREGAHVVAVERRTLGRVDFRDLLALDHADEFDGTVLLWLAHVVLLVGGGREIRQRAGAARSRSCGPTGV